MYIIKFGKKSNPKNRICNSVLRVHLTRAWSILGADSIPSRAIVCTVKSTQTQGSMSLERTMQTGRSTNHILVSYALLWCSINDSYLIPARPECQQP